MGIAIREFELAMEALNAEQLPKKEIQHGMWVPCFKVGDVSLVHSGTDFVFQIGNNRTIEIMQKAKAELGQNQNDLVHRNEIRSIRGLFTLVLMLENKYSKESVEKLIDETVTRLLNTPMLKTYLEKHYTGINLKNADTLYNLLQEYDKIINPFSCESSQKNPASYIDKIAISFSFNDNLLEKPNFTFSLSSMESTVEFIYSPASLTYYAEYLNDEKQETFNGYTSFDHYYITSNDNSDEIITLNVNDFNSSNLCLNISLKTGLAWESEGITAKPVTEEQLDFVICHLKKCISRIKNTITSKIII